MLILESFKSWKINNLVKNIVLSLGECW